MCRGLLELMVVKQSFAESSCVLSHGSLSMAFFCSPGAGRHPARALPGPAPPHLCVTSRISLGMTALWCGQIVTKEGPGDWETQLRLLWVEKVEEKYVFRGGPPRGQFASLLLAARCGISQGFHPAPHVELTMSGCSYLPGGLLKYLAALSVRG